jgi:N utilization substance protein A
VVRIEVQSKEFGRIAAQNAKSYILQMIREKERDAIYSQYSGKQRSIVSGTVQRRVGENLTINLGKTDAILNENEQVKSENLRPNDRVKVYVLEVKKTEKGSSRILVSRTHKDLVKCLFESEVAEIQDGTVEIKAIVREPGSRSKIAVWSNNPDVDAVGACVGVNSSRVNSVVDELRGEKVDIVNWDENPGRMIENALSPARIVAVFADPDTKIAKVVVPDDQLSLAIGLKGQNARLAAKLTNYKIDIKSETQAKDDPGFRYEDYLLDDDDEEYDDEYEYDEEYSDEEAAEEVETEDSDSEE